VKNRIKPILTFSKLSVITSPTWTHRQPSQISVFHNVNLVNCSDFNQRFLHVEAPPYKLTTLINGLNWSLKSRQVWQTNSPVLQIYWHFLSHTAVPLFYQRSEFLHSRR